MECPFNYFRSAMMWDDVVMLVMTSNIIPRWTICCEVLALEVFAKQISETVLTTNITNKSYGTLLKWYYNETCQNKKIKLLDSL